jgi:hypothetical protein
MRNNKKIDEDLQSILAPWEMRNSTIWKFPNLQAKWRGVLEHY